MCNSKLDYNDGDKAAWGWVLGGFEAEELAVRG